MLIVLIQECTAARGWEGEGGGGEGKCVILMSYYLSSRLKSFDQGCFIIPRGTLYNILYRDALPEKGTFFRPQIEG